MWLFPRIFITCFGNMIFRSKVWFNKRKLIVCFENVTLLSNNMIFIEKMIMESGIWRWGNQYLDAPWGRAPEESGGPRAQYMYRWIFFAYFVPYAYFLNIILHVLGVQTHIISPRCSQQRTSSHGVALVRTTNRGEDIWRWPQTVFVTYNMNNKDISKYTFLRIRT